MQVCNTINLLLSIKYFNLTTIMTDNTVRKKSVKVDIIRQGSYLFCDNIKFVMFLALLQWIINWFTSIILMFSYGSYIAKSFWLAVHVHFSQKI